MQVEECENKKVDCASITVSPKPETPKEGFMESDFDLVHVYNSGLDLDFDYTCYMNLGKRIELYQKYAQELRERVDQVFDQDAHYSVNTPGIDLIVISTIDKQGYLRETAWNYKEGIDDKTLLHTVALPLEVSYQLVDNLCAYAFQKFTFSCYSQLIGAGWDKSTLPTYS